MAPLPGLAIWVRELSSLQGEHWSLIRREPPGIIRVEPMVRVQSLAVIILTVRKSTQQYLTLKNQFAGVNVTVQGTNALVLKDANGTGITIKSNISHNVADSGMSIESNGNVNIDAWMVLLMGSANGNGGTLQIRGQAIVNTGRLQANGANGRLILAYESDYFEPGGSKDYPVDRDDPSANHR